MTDDPVEMANCFAASFSSVYDPTVPTNQSPHFSCAAELSDILITQEMVSKAIDNMDWNSSPGVDNIHPRLLKSLVSELCEPLTIIFNNSLQTGLLPALWTESIIIPIFKKSSRFNPLNYRPVSLTSVVCKIMERVLAEYLWEYILANDLISAEQFGFRKQHSTIDQLILTYEAITRMHDAGEIVDLVFFDYAKAFDRVSHEVLLTKLSHLGISGKILRWIEMFLTGRLMRVRAANAMSDHAPVESGVPQGSVLGPVLFLLYINHVVSGLRCSYKIFADDIKIYLGYTVDNTAEGSASLQLDIDHLVNTSASWNLQINSDKCAVMRFSSRSLHPPAGSISPYRVNSESLKFVDDHPDLGINIGTSLKFHAHIRTRANIAGALTTNLLSSTLCRDADFLMGIYTSHIRPQMEYGSSLWNMGFVGDHRLLERVQRRWTKAVFSVSHLSYHDRLVSLNLYSMYGRLLRADLILVWKIFNNKCAIKPSDLFEPCSTQSTRGHSLKLQVKRTRLDVRKRFFSNRIVPTWNALSAEAVEASNITKFKALIHRDLGDELFKFH